MKHKCKAVVQAVGWYVHCECGLYFMGVALEDAVDAFAEHVHNHRAAYGGEGYDPSNLVRGVAHRGV